jgi:transposase InsO family protein
MRFVFIRAHEEIYHITTMCRILEVSRAGYYKWRAQPLAERVKDDAILTAKIRAVHTGRRQAYGSPRVHRELRDQGTRIGKKRVARLMRAADIRAKTPRRYRITTRSDAVAPAAENELARQFAVAEQPGPDRVWVADITYVPTREGWLYLAILLDLATWRAADGANASLPSGWLTPFRSWRAIHERCLSAAARGGGLRGEHEPARQLLGQCGCRKLLQHPHEGTP